MRGYYHPTKNTYTDIPANEKIIFPVRFNNVPKEKRKLLKEKLLNCIESHPSVVFMHPSHRKQGITYFICGTTMIEPEFMKKALAYNFNDSDSLILIIGTVTISSEQNHDFFDFKGFLENKSPFNTKRRVHLIDSIMEDI